MPNFLYAVMNLVKNRAQVSAYLEDLPVPSRKHDGVALPVISAACSAPLSSSGVGAFIQGGGLHGETIIRSP